MVCDSYCSSIDLGVVDYEDFIYLVGIGLDESGIEGIVYIFYDLGVFGCVFCLVCYYDVELFW